MSTGGEHTADTIIQVNDASVTFDMDRGASKVLDSVTLDVNRNEILGIVGESGSGKSMFASALLDAVVRPGVLTGEIIYQPSTGDSFDILELGPTALKKFRWEKVSMVFQGAMSSFNPTLTIGGHFKETVEHHEYDWDEKKTDANQLLSDLYLDPDRVLASYPHELSGGMKQRALIALSLILDPEVVVMDEPTAALDLLMQRSILRLIYDLQKKYDLTVIFITHDLPLIAGLADRLAVMYAFKFVEFGHRHQVRAEPVHPYTRALFKAVPNIDSDVEEMKPIEGSSPDPVNVPAGCSYHPRCPLATDTCEQVEPDFEPVEEGHEVACFHWDQSVASIPLNIEAEATQ